MRKLPEQEKPRRCLKLRLTTSAVKKYRRGKGFIKSNIENGVHQLVKVAFSGVVALFGTYQIAANGVAQSIWSLASIMRLAMAPAYTTVIGQCMGARDIDAAGFYFKKLNKITRVLSVLWNFLIFAITPLIVRYSAISPEAKELVIWLVLIAG